jgi:ELWxxDGT repeat protein
MMMSLVRRWFRSCWSARSRPLRRTRTTLNLECLEDRACPTTYNLHSIDIFSGAGSSNPNNGVYSARSFVEYNGKLYFAADSNDGYGVELYRYDPNTQNVSRVSDINPTTGSSYPAWLTVYNGKLYFSAYHPTYGTELWSYDGSTNTFALAADINGGGSSNPAWLTVYAGKLYFSAYTPSVGTELHVPRFTIRQGIPVPLGGLRRRCHK